MIKFPWLPNRFILQWEEDGIDYKVMIQKVNRRDLYRLMLQYSPKRVLEDNEEADSIIRQGGDFKREFTRVMPAPDPWLPATRGLIDDLENLVKAGGVKKLQEAYQFDK